MLILVGFFSAGKTTYGKQLAQEKNLPFFDTDHLIESKYHAPVREIHRTLGEAAFRKLEHDVLGSLPDQPGILATGGGTPLTEENRNRLRQLGEIHYLKVPFDVLYTRILKRGFPTFIDKQDPYASCKKNFEMRESIYLEIADQILHHE